MCSGTPSVVNEKGLHTAPGAYPPYVPPPVAPNPATIWILNAMIIDGSENCRRFRANVRVRDGVIVSVERMNQRKEGFASPVSVGGILSALTGASTTSIGERAGLAPVSDQGVMTIDASNLILCPGFIDMHAHSDLHLLSHPSHIPKLSQGITLEVIGQDGIGYAPLVGVDRDETGHSLKFKRGLDGEQALEYVRKQIAGWNGNPEEPPAHWREYRRAILTPDPTTTDEPPKPASHEDGQSTGRKFFNWRTMARYLDTLDAHHLAVNVAVLVPQGNLRLLVLGPDPPLSVSSANNVATDSESTSASQKEIVQMRAILRRALDEGAVGMSSGLTYVPGMYADYAELKSLCEELVEARSPNHPGVNAYIPYFAPHHRSYGLDSLAAYDEMLRLGADTGAPIHLTHATLNFPPNAGKGDELLSMISEYEEKGVDVSLDTYPYTAGSTTLAAMLPSWAAGGGVDAVMRRLRGEGGEMKVVRDNSKVTLQGEELLEAIREDVSVKGSDGCHGLAVDWAAIEIAGLGTESAKGEPLLAALVGKTVADAARSFDALDALRPQVGVTVKGKKDLSDPFNLFLHILLSDSLSTSIIQHVGHEDNVRKVMTHRHHMFGTDALLAPSKCHPRAWGSTGRYLGWYARDILRAGDGLEQGWTGPDGREEPAVSGESPAPFGEVFALEEVIPHLTSRPACRLGLLWDPAFATASASSDDRTIQPSVTGSVETIASRPRLPRGIVAQGYAADLVLFDPNTVRDQATFKEPNQQCTGIEWVLVNGIVAVERGRVTGSRGGRTIRRDGKTGLVW